MVVKNDPKILDVEALSKEKYKTLKTHIFKKKFKYLE